MQANLGVQSASGGAVLLCQASGRWFALCFGTGWHLLRPDGFVRGFGLRAALSLVVRNTLKSVDVSTYENFAKHRRVSTSKGTTIDSFDIEGQLDLLRGVIGDCERPQIGQQIGGRDSCVTWTKLDITELPRLCGILFRAYSSSRAGNRYPIINNVDQVRDPAEIQRLDDLLDAEIAANPNLDVSIAPPEAVDWQSVQAFTIDHANAPAPKVSFDFGDVRGLYNPNSPTCNDMSHIAVGTQTVAGTPGLQGWSLYDCIVTEISDPTNPAVRCILLAGDWYVVSASFVTQVNNDLAAINLHAGAMPHANAGETEGDYNARFAATDPVTLALLDKKNIPYGGGSSRIEVCDVLSSQPCLYHVKDYHGSATLSHLFSQGTVSGRLLLEQDFRQEIVTKYPHLPGNVIQSAAIAPNNFEVVYAIICEPARTIPGGLPFFSKVRLVEAAKELRRMGYTNVSVAKIPRP